MSSTANGILVTGASSGIGLETAVHLAKCGYRVVASVRYGRREDLDRRAAALGVQLGVVEMDVSDTSSVKNAVEQAEAESGGLYGLVNNAGTILSGYFEDVSDAEMRSVFETNVFGTMAVTRAVLPYLRNARRGKIIIMSSTGGKLATPGNSAYCSSKFALEGLGEALRQELVPFGIGVSLVEPGFIRTELFGRNKNVAARALQDGPYRRWFERLQELTDTQVRNAITPASAVAEVVQHILDTPTPRLRYVVGSRARILLGLRRYLPGETFDRVWIPGIIRRLRPAGGVDS